MALPADLAAMLGQLSAMRAPDRDFVLAQLGPDGTRKLLPLLDQFQRIEISDGLQAMVAQSAREDAPADMTRRGAAALRQAASNADVALPSVATKKVSVRESGVLARASSWLGLGA